MGSKISKQKTYLMFFLAILILIYFLSSYYSFDKKEGFSKLSDNIAALIFYLILIMGMSVVWIIINDESDLSRSRH